MLNLPKDTNDDSYENEIQTELEEFNETIDYHSLDEFFGSSNEDLDIETEDAIALNQFLNKYM